MSEGLIIEVALNVFFLNHYSGNMQDGEVIDIISMALEWMFFLAGFTSCALLASVKVGCAKRLFFRNIGRNLPRAFQCVDPLGEQSVCNQ